jgi:threonine dehydrogenase-like Zn-dependent dehydrogenase
MRALVWHGKEDVRYDTVTDPEIEDPRDAIVEVTSCAICGSDLHLFHNFIPAMLPGDIMGHEMMGEVVDVGRGVNGKPKKGDRVVVPFTIICGQCEQCKRGNFSVCEATNRKKKLADKAFGHATAGLIAPHAARQLKIWGVDLGRQQLGGGCLFSQPANFLGTAKIRRGNSAIRRH